MALVLSDHSRAVICNLCNREAGVFQSGDLLEKAIVTASCLAAALDHMTSDDGASQLVVITGLPAVIPCGGATDDGGVGSSASYHNIRTAIEGLGDAPAAYVGIGGKHILFTQCFARIHVLKSVTGGLKFGQTSH